MGVSSIISEIKEAIGRKSLFFKHPVFDAPVRGYPSKYCHTVSYRNKNLAIANRSRVSRTDNAMRAPIGLNITPWPWNLGLRSLKVTKNETIGEIINDLLLVELFDVKYYRELEMWVRGHSRSLKMVLFESLGTVCYSPSIVTMAVSLAISEIFSVKEWPDL